MPLDRALARRRVEGARTAYSRGPHAEFIQNLANDLDQALTLVSDTDLTVMRAQGNATTLERALDEEKDAYRKLKERGAHTEAMLGLLREIAANGKGAQKKAAAFLKTIGAEMSAAPVAVPEPERIIVP